jgi:hypothetical protein
MVPYLNLDTDTECDFNDVGVLCTFSHMSAYEAGIARSSQLGSPLLPQAVRYVMAGGTARVSFKTSFDSKQPKLEPKLVSALSETKRFIRFFGSVPKQRVSVFRFNRNKQ